MPSTTHQTYDTRRIRDSVSLARVVESYGVALKPHGPGRLVGLCPFHQEKTGSFVVYVRDRTSGDEHAFCYGCNWTGDAIKFIQEAGGVQFLDAIKILIEQYGADGRENLTDASTLKRIRDIQGWFGMQRGKVVALIGLCARVRRAAAGGDDPRLPGEMTGAIKSLMGADDYFAGLAGGDIATFFDAYGRRKKDHPAIMEAFSGLRETTMSILRDAQVAMANEMAKESAADAARLRAAIAREMWMSSPEEIKDEMEKVNKILAGGDRATR